MTTRQFITEYHGQNIYFSLSARMYLVDTGKIIYFRNTLDEVKFLIDNLEGYKV